jgi:hypothetical protein
MSEIGKTTPGPWIIQDEREMCDEIWIGVEHPEVGFVSHAAVRSGCGEADELGDMEANAALIVKAVNGLEKMREALEAAEQFIVNGVEFGFIRMPDKDDSALDTLPKIRAALKEARSSLGEVTG